jgi:hypothetical protein
MMPVLVGGGNITSGRRTIAARFDTCGCAALGIESNVSASRHSRLPGSALICRHRGIAQTVFLHSRDSAAEVMLVALF